MLLEGIHSISLAAEQRLDICIKGLDRFSEKNRNILVFFSGAISNRKGKCAPFFSGLNIAKELRSPVITISDPTLAMSDELNISWYAGNKFVSNLPEKIAVSLDHISTLLNARLTLVGGSADGYGALSVSEHLEKDAVVFVWNPQTVIENYVNMFVHKYINVALDYATALTYSREDFSNTLDAHHIKHRLTYKSLNSNIQFIYLQNFSDGHTVKQLTPFVCDHSIKRITKSGYQISLQQHFIYVGNWGEGHIQPPRSVIEFILSEIIKGECLEQIVVDLDQGICGDIQYSQNINFHCLKQIEF